MKFGVAHGNARHRAPWISCASAEDAGFDQFWIFDLHAIWQDCYCVLGWLIGLSRSETMEFGTLVTNPVSRDPDRDCERLRHARGDHRRPHDLRHRRGDSVVRVMKRKPAKLADLEHAVNLVPHAPAGETMKLEGVDVEIEWAEGASSDLRRRLRSCARSHSRASWATA